MSTPPRSAPVRIEPDPSEPSRIEPIRIEVELLRWTDEAPSAAVPSGGVIDGARTLDFAELARRATGFAEELDLRGVQPGDRVAIFLEHGLEQIVALYAAWIRGAIAVPVNSTLKSPQVAHILSNSESRVLVSDSTMLARLEREAWSDVPAIQISLQGDTRENVSAPAHARELPGGDTPAAILYTSGSTGRPKGILISHANLLAGARIVSCYLGIHREERILSVLPFSFDYGLNQLLSAVHVGCTLVLQRSHFPSDVLHALQVQRITALAGVPPLWIQLMGSAAAVRSIELPHLRYITNSGGVFPAPVVRRYRETWPHVRVFLMYGLSEAFRSTYLPPEELDARPDSMGRSIPECEVLVLAAEGGVATDDEPGELVHRGPTVALGYWKDPEATARVFRPDPLDADATRKVVYSGDLVKRDAQGFLYFVGRRDQLIKSYGFRISPDEVEELIHASRLVAEVVVRGRPDPIAGAAIVAHVVPVDPALFEPGALLEYCRANMPAYMVPRTIEVHDALPRTATGKIDRKAVVG